MKRRDLLKMLGLGVAAPLVRLPERIEAAEIATPKGKVVHLRDATLRIDGHDYTSGTVHLTYSDTAAHTYGTASWTSWTMDDLLRDDLA